METAVQIAQIVIAVFVVLGFGVSFFNSYTITRVKKKAELIESKAAQIEEGQNGLKDELVRAVTAAADAKGYARGRREEHEQQERDNQGKP